MLLMKEKSALLVVDVQAKLLPAMEDADLCLRRCRMLIMGARHLGIPVRASEQYPQGLGPSVEGVKALLHPEEIFPKTHFACGADTTIAASISALERKTVLICGIEAHVCVLQTALDLQARGFTPVVVADATSSRRAAAKSLAFERLRGASVPVVDTEMTLFEWLEMAGTDEFNSLLPMIKSEGDLPPA